MSAEAKSEDLVYATGDEGNVYVYSFPHLKLVGTINVGINLWGDCVDRAGDVFVTALESGSVRVILEYAHGDTAPIATLNDPYQPEGCSVDPTTGNLAVTSDTIGSSSAPSAVAIYKDAKGTPKLYQDPEIEYYNSCAYDDRGNLYVDGVKASTWKFAELPRKSSTFVNLSVDATLSYEEGVQWDGRFITISRTPFKRGRLKIDRLTVSGTTATVVGTTHLVSRSRRFEGLDWIQDSMIVQPHGKSYSEIGIWKYPSGGAVKNTRNVGVPLYGVTVSLGRH